MQSSKTFRLAAGVAVLVMLLVATSAEATGQPSALRTALDGALADSNPMLATHAPRRLLDDKVKPEKVKPEKVKPEKVKPEKVDLEDDDDDDDDSSSVIVVPIDSGAIEFLG